MRAKLKNEVSISDLQIAEMAAFSMAMVVRYALGLSSAGAQVGVLVADCLPGWVALATTRHLLNNGTLVTIIEQSGCSERSQTYQTLLKSALACAADYCPYDDGTALQLQLNSLDNYHNLIVGCVDIGAAVASSPDHHTLTLVEAINEHPVPVHAIELTWGIDPHTAQRHASALYAASTLSIGVPLAALCAARDYVGRHYLCDISLPWSFYEQHNITSSALFSEQPVIQLKFPEDA